ncbi:unnamed protein product [Spirodela intermedia]|uniref:Uncharacterized protein n=1 Tax=Spirodela intermedia TaxID=51605 RepID=A0A7I8J4U3_SPIIN|nr:unnamed protein product [Spirodela intermedia]CAA6665074.1 unnamed protein product [Spirodela intermedia]
MEELQQEINSFQHQLQLAEERLRFFEPEHLSMSSPSDLEASERFVLDALARVTQRKKSLMGGGNLLPYDDSTLQASPPKLFNLYEVASWVADGDHHPGQMFVSTSEPFMSLRESALYDSLQKGTGGLHVEPSYHLGDCQLSEQGDGVLPPWHQAYTSTELLSSLLPPTPFLPLLQSGPSYSHPIMPGPNGESVACDSGLAAVGEVNVQ